jgi:hypothetical protein
VGLVENLQKKARAQLNRESPCHTVAPAWNRRHLRDALITRQRMSPV